MKRFKDSGLLVLCAFTAVTSGCIAIPRVKTFPSRPLRHITVKDFDTGEVLDDAVVTCAIVKWDNWMAPYPWWEICDAPEPSKWQACGYPISEEDYILDGQLAGKGTFEFAPVTKWGSVRVWALPLPLGCFEYHTHHGMTVVKAPNHKTICITSDLPHAKGSIAQHYSGGNAPQKTYLFIEDDRTTVLLPALTAD